MKIVLYARFSPRPNAEECDSIDGQLTIMRRHCQQKGWEVAAEFADYARSGDDEDREGFWAAVKLACRLAKTEEVGFLVTRSDRLARGTILAHQFRQTLRKEGVAVLSVEGFVGNGDPEGVAIETILDAVNELYKRIGAARTSSAMNAHLSRGRSISSWTPYGKRTVDGEVRPPKGYRGELVDDATEMRAIRRIVQLRDQGMNPEKIARVLNREHLMEELAGEPGYPPRGKEWRRRVIANILRRVDQGIVVPA